MIVTDHLCSGHGVQIGSFTLRVIAVHSGEVVFALFDPSQDCARCGERPARRRHCPLCHTEAMVCSLCVRSWLCPQCATV
jgi:hypothetical protein